MSKSAFAGFCLTAFAGGVVTTVLVDRLSGRPQGGRTQTAGATAQAPAPVSRRVIGPELEALPSKPAAEPGLPDQLGQGERKAAPAGPPTGASAAAVPRAAKPSGEPPRRARGVRSAGSRKVAATDRGAGGEAPATAPAVRWSDPFAE